MRTSTLREYQVFVAIVDHYSITKAAYNLHLSIPSVSRHLAKLEAHLGIRLVDRNTHTLEITDLGLEFYEHCKDVLLNISAGEEQVQQSSVEPGGKITVSFSRVMLTTRLMALFADFQRSYPLIKFDIQICDDMEDLISKQMDFRCLFIVFF